jgi:putative acid phosphatase of HAD superfamily subfamily IIIB
MVSAARLRPARRAAVTTAGLLAAALVGGGVAIAATAQPAIQTKTPRTEADVTNVDVDKQQVKNYYGDPLGTGKFGADSNYVKEVKGVERDLSHYLARHHHTEGTKAIVLDVDDTTLNTWEFELSVNFAFSPAAQQPFVDQQKFVPEPGMVDVVREAEREGYAIFYLTGRGAAQEKARTVSSPSPPWPTTRTTSRRRARTTRTVRARPSTTSPRPARTSSRSATTSSPTSVTSSVTSRAATPTAPSRSRTRRTSSPDRQSAGLSVEADSSSGTTWPRTSSTSTPSGSRARWIAVPSAAASTSAAIGSGSIQSAR